MAGAADGGRDDSLFTQNTGSRFRDLDCRGIGLAAGAGVTSGPFTGVAAA
jgi:hypothetical protein